MLFPTIQSAVNSACSGDTIRIRAGVYFENIIVEGRSGNFLNPIIMEGYKGERVIIDGADKGLQKVGNKRWVKVEKDKYQAIVPFRGNQKWNRISSVSFGDKDSLMATYWFKEKLDTLERGSGIIREGNKVTLRLKGNAEPSQLQINIGLADGVIKFRHSSFWTVRNLEIKHAGFAGIYLEGPDIKNVIIDNVYINDAYRGISTDESASGSNILIRNCTISNNMPWGTLWQGYDDHGGAEDDCRGPQRTTGIMIKDASYVEIMNCEINGWWDGMKLTGWHNQAHHNLIHNIDDDMVELESSNSNDIRFYNNIGYNLAVGISLINNKGGNIYIYRNQVVCTRPKKYKGRIHYGYCIKLGKAWGEKIAENVKIYNNTFYSYRAPFWDSRTARLKNFEFINNIFFTGHDDRNFVNRDTLTHSFQNGCHWESNLWNKETGLHEKGMIVGDPYFVKINYKKPEDLPDLKVTEGSMVIDSGSNYAILNKWPDSLPFIQNKPDIGAFEYGVTDQIAEMPIGIQIPGLIKN